MWGGAGAPQKLLSDFTDTWRRTWDGNFQGKLSPVRLCDNGERVEYLLIHMHYIHIHVIFL